MLRLGAALVAVVVWVGASPVARADEDDAEAARNHYLAGKSYYEEARYEDALREFLESYRRAPRGAIQFDVAACHEHLGHLGDAVTALERYLRETPNADDRAVVERRIANLKERLAATPPPSAPSSPAATPVEQAAMSPPPATATSPSEPSGSSGVVEGATAMGCAPGQVLTSGHCCWPAQHWDPQTRRCDGIPECPRGFSSEVGTCIPRAAGATTPDVGADWPSVQVVPIDGETAYSVILRHGTHENTCVTPCALKLPPGPALLAVSLRGQPLFSHAVDVPTRPSVVRLANKCTACYIAGGVLLGVGGAVFGVGLGLYLTQPPDKPGQSSTANDTVVNLSLTIGGGVIALAGIVSILSGGRDRVEVLDRTMASRPGKPRLASVGIAPTPGGATAAAAFTY